MAIAKVGTYQFNYSTSTTTTTLSLSYTTVNLGDLVVIQSTTGSASSIITGLSGGGVTTWTKAASVTGTGTGQSLWYGVVTTVGSVSLTVTNGATTGGAFVASVEQFTAGFGASTQWSLDGTPVTASVSASTTLTFPTLTAAAADELWYGYVSPQNVGAVGSTSGFTYQREGTAAAPDYWSNIIAYRLTTGAGSVTAPTASQDVSGTYVHIGALFVAAQGFQLVSPSGIATAEAFGTAAVSATVTISPSGIASGEAFGTALVNDGIVHPPGIVSAETFGSATITTGPTSVFPTGIGSAQAAGTPDITITFDLTKLPPVPRRATGYELVCVSRVNSPSGPPAFFEVDPISWKGLSWVEELSRPTQLNASVKIDTLTDSVIQRLTHLDELGTELWLYRDGRLVHAGPWENWTTQGDTMTFVSRGLLGYLDYWAVTADLVFAGADQFAIVKGLIDQWQNTIPYGNFGIDTSTVGGSGVNRDATYKAVELHNIGQRVRELGTRLNGFDIAVDPSTRALTLGYPQLGVDRSSGPDAIVFDSLNITNINIGCTVGPGDLASEAIGTGTGTAGPLISTKSNLDLRARFGATAVTRNFDGVSEQATLDDHTQGLLDARADALLIPGPGVRSTLDADIGAYAVGDTVAYELHQRLGLSGSFRLRKRTVTVSPTGVEKATFEFV